MKNKNLAYVLIIIGLLLGQILSWVHISFWGIGYLETAILICGLILLYKNKETRPKGTVVGHSFSGVVLLVIGGMFMFAALLSFGPNLSYTASQKAEAAFGLVFIVLGLYSFTKASQVK